MNKKPRPNNRGNKPTNKNDKREPRLPRDTRKCLDGHRIDNYCLKLNKTAVQDSKQKRFVLYETEKGRSAYDVSHRFAEKDVRNIAGRQKDLIEKSGLLTKSFELSPTWRLVVGLGHHSVYETAITLHHIYGIPYIPGSAVKGVTRSWVITSFFGDCEGNRNRGALADVDFCRIFGSPRDSVLEDRRGAVVFFDAYPVTSPCVEVDVMNAHFSDYYTQGKAPADYLKPNPVSFLTVKDTKFLFAVGINPEDNKNVSVAHYSGKMLDVVSTLLRKALQEHGIGAKTAVGYGIMAE